jgi:carboxyl-terminal processing protease
MRSRAFNAPRVVAYVVAAILLLLVGTWFGGHPSWLPSPLRSAFVDQGNGQLVNEALDILSRDYYRPIDRSQLTDKGLAAAVASLNDPYSHYFNPSDYHAFLNQSDPHLSGIGIEVLPEKQGLRITEVFPDSPAARAGLQRGDLIVSVGGVSLANRSNSFGSRLIKGRAGTKVKLTVVNGKQKRDVVITRANLVVPVASSDLLTYHGMKIGVVRLTSFTDGSSGELRLQVEKVLRAGDCSTRRSRSRASSYRTGRSCRPTGVASRDRCTSPRGTRSRRGFRWSSLSTAGRRRPRRS